MTDRTPTPTDRDDDRRTEQQTSDRQTMADVSHTDPFRNRSAGALFRRGPTVVADGGKAEQKADDDTEKPRMRDVDHTPRDGESANRVFERGSEHGGEDPINADAAETDEDDENVGDDGDR